MSNFGSVFSLLKLVYIFGLFTAFIILCARPAFHNFQEAGVIIEKSVAQRTDQDSPSITFCALNEDGFGWKEQSAGKINYRVRDTLL